MSKRQGRQTVTQMPDQHSRYYIEAGRRLGLEGRDLALGGPESYLVGELNPGDIAAAMNPYLDQVLGGIRGEYDFLRGQARLDENARATSSGAYGGDRAALALGAREGALDRAQAAQVGQAYQTAYGQALPLAEHQRQLRERSLQEPLWRYGQGLNFLNLGMGPIGTETVQSATRGRNPWASALGGAATGSVFGWPGAIAGGLIGAFS